MLYEGARFHKQRYEQYGNQLADLANLVRQGLQISVGRYEENVRYIDSCRVQFAQQFKRTPVILTPAAMGPAPTGLASTGDPRMNAPWTEWCKQAPNRLRQFNTCSNCNAIGPVPKPTN